MAQRRMFSKTITQSSVFLRMPMSSRLLYYDLGMNADDDGYCEWYPVTTMTGAKEQDLQVLQANGLIKVFDENVLIIKDWKENNYIQKDRYTPSKYLNVYTLDTECIQNVSSGKVRIGKVSEGKETYGELQKVLLTPEEYQKLTNRYGEGHIKALIEELDNYIASTGKRYQSHYATLLNWARRKIQEHHAKQIKSQRTVL